MPSTLAGYELVAGPPSPEDYVRLREQAKLLPLPSDEQAASGLHGAWAACHVVQEATDLSVAMGRVVGDGGWYFHIIDMAVHPDHRRRGIGSAVLSWLIERVDALAPPGATVNLIADPPGQGLYARHGFVPTAPDAIGMTLRRSYLR